VRVTFDARHLQTVARVRGIGRYTRNLLAAFAAIAPGDIEWTLLRLRSFPRADPSSLPPHRELSTLRLRRPELSMLALDPILLSVELARARPDVYHSTQLSLPARRSFRAVVTVHDVAPLIWPGDYLRLPHARIGHEWQYALARRADAIIAVSEATKRDVVERLGVVEGHDDRVLPHRPRHALGRRPRRVGRPRCVGRVAADDVAHPVWTDNRESLKLAEEIYTAAIPARRVRQR
jgi:glycosyltransferase involved in cell wall biosynthesis